MSLLDDQQILDDISIASPCSVPWESMAGDERIRFCQKCNLSVYNISELSSKEVVDLLELQNHLGSKLPCMRLFKRADGTVLTGDCPIGVRRLEHVRRLWRRIAAALLGFFTFMHPARAGDDQPPSPSRLKHPSREIEFMVSPQAPHSTQREIGGYHETMGVPIVGFTPFMKDLQKRISANCEKDKVLAGSDRVVVKFNVEKYGTIQDLKVHRSSGSQQIDNAALAAIRRASPFNPLPPGSTDKIEVEYTFQNRPAESLTDQAQ